MTRTSYSTAARIVVVCLALLMTFMAGRWSAGVSDWSRNKSFTTGDGAPARHSRGIASHNIAHLEVSGENSGTRAEPLWSRQIADLYAAVEPGKPTAGFANLFKAAIDRGEPYSQGFIQMLFEGMRREDLPQALELMKLVGAQGKFRGSSGTGNQSVVWQTFWNRFGELDPITALREVHRLGDLQYFGIEYAEKNIFHGWAQHDPAAAAKAYLLTGDLLQPGYAAQGIAYEWARKDLRAATLWTDENLTGELHSHAFRSMAYAVVHTSGFQSAVTWWQQISEEEDRKAVLAAISDMSNRRGPSLGLDERVAIINAGLEMGVRDESIEMQVAHQFGSTDPATGAELFTQFPSTGDSTRYNGLTAVLMNWGKVDPPAAAKWVQSQQTEAWYDSAAAGLAASIYERDVVAATDWLNTIQNDKMREQITLRLSKKNSAGR